MSEIPFRLRALMVSGAHSQDTGRPIPGCDPRAHACGGGTCLGPSRLLRPRERRGRAAACLAAVCLVRVGVQNAVLRRLVAARVERRRIARGGVPERRVGWRVGGMVPPLISAMAEVVRGRWGSALPSEECLLGRLGILRVGRLLIRRRLIRMLLIRRRLIRRPWLVRIRWERCWRGMLRPWGST